jgi:hypothetical protein
MELHGLFQGKVYFISKEENPSGEADSCSVTQEFPNV